MTTNDVITVKVMLVDVALSAVADSFTMVNESRREPVTQVKKKKKVTTKSKRENLLSK